MEESIPKIRKKVKISTNKYENEPSSNNNTEAYKIIIEKLTKIINTINENFDFKTYEKEKLNSIEKVNNNHI